MADIRKSLERLRLEWEDCVKCDLGKRRLSVEGSFVFGEGLKNCIMFIGEGPGKDEEIHGRPFIGRSGTLLRKVLDKLNFTEHYITNLVACRSCVPATDGTGQPIFKKDYRTKQMLPLMRDEPPLPMQIEACLPRLHEEIYLVDPVLIVAVGGTAAKTLIGKSLSITDHDVHGNPFEISIPGAGFKTVRTDKKGAWVRKVGGKVAMPIETSSVRYLCIPTLHPAYVLRTAADQSADSTVMQFARDIQKAVQIYERYMYEMHGVMPVCQTETDLDLSINDDDGENDGQ